MAIEISPEIIGGKAERVEMVLRNWAAYFYKWPDLVVRPDKDVSVRRSI